MTDSAPDEAWMEMQDGWKQMIEAATGVKQMALDAGFEQLDASMMGP